MTKHYTDILKDLEALRNPAKAAGAMKFFQSYPGGY
jgi:hypothetical protein